MAEPAPTPAGDAHGLLIERYLEHVRVEKRLAARTVTLYQLDLEKLAGFAAAVPVDLPAVLPAHVRRWVAQMHADVVGGLRVDMGDYVIDGTVASRVVDARRKIAG